MEATNPASGCANWWRHLTVIFSGIRLVLKMSSAPFFPFLNASNTLLILLCISYSIEPTYLFLKYRYCNSMLWTYLFISQIVTSSELKITTHSTLYKHSYTVQTMLCVPSTVANSNGKHIFQKNGCTVVIMRKLWEKLKHAPYRKNLFQTEKHFFWTPFHLQIFPYCFL
jgi:hypothetical protein